MLNMSFVTDVFLGISQKYSFITAILKENLMDVPYFIKEHLWMSASNEATCKIIFCGYKPSS